MTHHERTTLADRCARCDGIPDAQVLLAEMRAQLGEARRERDEARERARVSDRCRLANEAELRRADAQIGHLRAALKEAGEGAAQALLAEKALAAEKAALAARVGVLSELVRRLAKTLDAVQVPFPDGFDLRIADDIDAARAALEVES